MRLSGALQNRLAFGFLLLVVAFCANFFSTRKGMMGKQAVVDIITKNELTYGSIRLDHEENQFLSGPESPELLAKLLVAYEEYHKFALASIKSGGKPRFVVVQFFPGAGTCNRAMSLLSAVLLALATDRVLLFDWEKKESRVWSKGMKEVVGQSDFREIFGQSPIAFSYRDALNLLGKDDRQMREESMSFHSNDNQIVEAILYDDLDVVFPQRVLYIVDRWDYWGSAFFYSEVYAEPFKRINRKTAFKTLFQWLLPPPDDVQRIECNWLFQIRTQWERQAPPDSKFIECATNHGFSPSVHSGHLLTDSNTTSNVTASLKRFGGDYCRTGSVECERAVIRTMYEAAQCKHAILSATSTFGRCISALGAMSDVYEVVAKDGRCQKVPFDDPDTAGYDSRKKVPHLRILAKGKRNMERFAYAIIVSQPVSEDSLKQLHEILHALAARTTYQVPVILLVRLAEGEEVEEPLRLTQLMFPARRVIIVPTFRKEPIFSNRGIQAFKAIYLINDHSDVQNLCGIDPFYGFRGQNGPVVQLRTVLDRSFVGRLWHRITVERTIESIARRYEVKHGKSGDSRPQGRVSAVSIQPFASEDYRNYHAQFAEALGELPTETELWIASMFTSYSSNLSLVSKTQPNIVQ